MKNYFLKQSFFAIILSSVSSVFLIMMENSDIYGLYINTSAITLGILALHSVYFKSRLFIISPIIAVILVAPYLIISRKEFYSFFIIFGLAWTVGVLTLAYLFGKITSSIFKKINLA
jgi:hypothetical protein